MPVKSKEPIGPCEVSLDIEVESTKVAEAVDKAYREFSKYIAAPGFRRGKAPLAVVKQRVPQDQLRERTAEILTGPAYEQALAESNIVPYARPSVEMVKLETVAPDFVFEFKAIVPLPPAVTLGNYVGLEVDRERMEVTDGDVEGRIQALRDRATQYPSIDDRAAEIGDVIEGELSVTFDDMDSDGKFEPTAITLGDPGNLAGTDEALVGIANGEERAFDLVYPADFPNAELAGKRAQAVVRVKELHGCIVPELGDAFAKDHGAESMDELRKRLRGELEKRSLEIAESAVRGKLVDSIVESSTIDYPSVLLAAEVEAGINAFGEDLVRREIPIERYLSATNQTEQELVEQIQKNADIHLRRGLALGEIAIREKIAVTDEDVDREIQSRADANHATIQAMRAYIDRAGDMKAVRDAVFTNKVIGFVKAAATITDKVVKRDAPAVAPPDAQKAKKPRKKKEAVEAGSAE